MFHVYTKSCLLTQWKQNNDVYNSGRPQTTFIIIYTHIYSIVSLTCLLLHPGTRYVQPVIQKSLYISRYLDNDLWTSHTGIWTSSIEDKLEKGCNAQCYMNIIGLSNMRTGSWDAWDLTRREVGRTCTTVMILQENVDRKSKIGGSLSVKLWKGSGHLVTKQCRGGTDRRMHDVYQPMGGSAWGISTLVRFLCSETIDKWDITSIR